jgi:hypothetical protein
MQDQEALKARLLRDRAALVQPNMDANRGLAPVVFGAGIGKTEPIAIVGYGPSLRQQWHWLLDYKYIWTTSGAHDYLLARGITPTFHTDVDWSDHKTKFIKTPHPGVEYRMCNGVHPSYVEKLRGSRLTMFEPALPADLYRSTGEYPVVPMYAGAGGGAVLLAHLDGWKTQHWFGLDHCYEWADPEPQKADIAEATKHAGAHESKHLPSELVYVNVAPGRQFYETSLQLLVMAKMLMHTAVTSNIKPVVYGDSLIQDWVAFASGGPA